MSNELQICLTNLSQKTKTVLIVDDNNEIKKSLSFIVEKFGCNVLVASNGCDAIDLYKQKIPDVVFMDVRMPIMSGCDALKEIKEIDANANIIFITAYSGDRCLLDLSKSFPLRILEKPFEFSKIEEILKSL